MPPTTANMIDLAAIAFDEVKRAPLSPLYEQGVAEELEIDNNPQVEVDLLNVRIAPQEQPAPPNSPAISNKGSVEVSTEDNDVAATSQEEGNALRSLGLGILFVSTMVMPFLKTLGVFWIIQYDIDQDAHCKINDCLYPVNKTETAVYIMMAIGFLSCAFAHFSIGCILFSHWPIGLPKLLNPMKVFAIVTGLEILVLTITFPTIHLTVGMAVSCISSFFLQFIALSNILCYSVECKYCNTVYGPVDGDVCDEQEAQWERQGMDEEERTYWNTIPRESENSF